MPCMRCDVVWHRSGAAADGRARPEAMGAKNDLVVWLRLQPEQQRIYEVLPALHASTY